MLASMDCEGLAAQVANMDRLTHEATKMELEKEEMHLRRAIETLEQVERRILDQEKLIQELEKDGHDISLALRLLATMRETRHVLLGHRDCIVKTIHLTRKS